MSAVTPNPQSGGAASPPGPSDPEGLASLSVQLSVLQAELASSQQQVVDLSQALAASEAAKTGLQEQLDHLDVKVCRAHSQGSHGGAGGGG